MRIAPSSYLRQTENGGEDPSHEEVDARQLLAYPGSSQRLRYGRPPVEPDHDHQVRRQVEAEALECEKILGPTSSLD